MAALPPAMGAAARHAPSARLICGLGNGPVGRGSRHALGLRLLDQLAAAHGMSWALFPSLGAFVATRPPGEPPAAPAPAAAAAAPAPLYLVWPLLPYNVAGWSVAAAARRFGVPPAGITVVHDDLDRRVGELRWKDGGSAGGNNGVKSVIASLGTDAFRRLRVGIGRPPVGDDRGRGNIVAWVLGVVPAEDWQRIAAAWAAPELQSALLQHRPPPEPEAPARGGVVVVGGGVSGAALAAP